MPSAVRNSGSTTTMRVNKVIITRIDGASDSTVNSAINQLDDARVQVVPLTEIDADVLRGEQRRQKNESTEAALFSHGRGGPKLMSSVLLAHHVLPAGRPNKFAISCSRVS